MGLVGRRTALSVGGVAMGVLAVCAAGSAHRAWAQETDTVGEEEAIVLTDETAAQAGVTQLQRIIIGAGHEKVAIDTPQAVTVVEQEDIDQEQPTMVGDVLKRIPGVNTSGSDRMFGQTFNIRGVGAPEQAGEEGRIIVQVDGATKYYEQYRMGGFFSDPELYKKVEVLRGPASSTLYGSGALGGVISFTTKDAGDFLAPGQKGMVKLKGTYNSNRNDYLGSVIYAQRLSDWADFLMVGNYRTSDNYLTGDGSEVRSSDFETWSGLVKTTYAFDDEARLRLSYQHWDSDADDQDYAQTGTDTLIGGSPLFGTVDRHVVDRTAVVSYENPFSGNDWLDLKISASLSDTTTEQRDATGNPGFGLTCATSQLFCDTDYGYRTVQFNFENTAEARGVDWENYFTYGYQFAEQTRTASVLNGTPGIGFHPEGTDTKHGFFVQNEFIWNEALTIIPGVRFDMRRLVPDPATGVTQNTEDTALSPKIAAHYRFNENFAIFGSFAHTERFPTIDEMFSTSSSSSTFDPSLNLVKERSNNYEAGFAVSGYDLAAPGDSLQLKTTAFHNTIDDLIALNPALAAGPNPGQPGYVNLNNAQIYGVEVELAYDSQYVFASAGYSHVIGRDTDSGLHLTTVAPDEISFTLGGRLPDRGLEFGWKGRVIADPQDECRVSTTAVTCPGGSSSRFAEAFDVHDVFVTWKPEEVDYQGWEARFGVENIFDTQYKEFLHNDAARGRTFKITLARAIGW